MPYTNDRLPDPELHAEFYADVPMKRAIAWIVDGVLIAILTIVAIPFTAFTALFFLPLLWLVLGFLYRVMTLAGGSATWGMRLMAISFRTHNGGPMTLPEAFLHTLIYSLSMSFVVPQLISIGTMLFTERGQSLGDLFLGTVAINRSARA
ncbi:RDD family protein [Actibacterium sp. 188UL27-1]|nr:RDD family protein [Actibacterium sp. 188UL27-1]MBM7066713.1 RDD family protein [Actibacterium sp. 188UL27-1]